MLIRRLFILMSALVLFGCAGSVHRDNNVLHSGFAADSVSPVEIRMTDDALKLQEDNSQSQFRVRSSFSAVMFGFMADSDSIDGKVREFNQEGRQVHSFDVSASYALGGIAGGDGTRMNWLYDKFTELTIAELTGNTDGAPVQKEKRKEVHKREEGPTESISGDRRVGETSHSPGSGEIATARPAARHDFTLPEDSHFASLGDADAIPYVKRHAQDSYALNLTRTSPRAYVIAPDGSWTWRAGRNALSNALTACGAKTGSTCYPYAIDNRIVWQSDDVAREALRKKLLAEVAANQNGDTLVLKVQAQSADK